MSRMLKFRAWNILTSHYYDVESLKADGSIVARYIANGEVNYLAMPAEELKIEQYVCKDKNGKDVYEGDIVRCSCPECGKELISDVAYNNTKHKFTYKTDSECWRHIHTIDDDEVQLIGNIHEHPELLLNFLKSLDMSEDEKKVQREKLRKLLEKECES